MDHHGGVHVIEHALVQHGDLAAPALFGRGPEHPDGQVQVVGQGGQTQPRADRRGGDDVVTAGMPHTGQRVVLGADRHDHRP